VRRMPQAGADVAINYKSEDFVAATKAATEGKGADVILDMVGGDYIERNYEAAAVEGRVVQIALQAGAKATVNFHRIMLKRLTHTGSTLRARSISDKGAIARAVEEQVLPLIAAGRSSR
jgi:NADPH2:quinone reductase